MNDTTTATPASAATPLDLGPDAAGTFASRLGLSLVPALVTLNASPAAVEAILDAALETIRSTIAEQLSGPPLSPECLPTLVDVAIGRIRETARDAICRSMAWG